MLPFSHPNKFWLLPAIVENGVLPREGSPAIIDFLFTLLKTISERIVLSVVSHSTPKSLDLLYTFGLKYWFTDTYIPGLFIG